VWQLFGAPTSENAVTIEGDAYDQRRVFLFRSACRVDVSRKCDCDTVMCVDTVAPIYTVVGVVSTFAVSLNAIIRRLPRLSAGYRAFDSGIFSPVDFSAMVTDGVVLILAERGDMDTVIRIWSLPGETRLGYVVFSFVGDICWYGYLCSFYLPHLVVPASRGFVKQGTYFWRKICVFRCRFWS
jgi:hypothetical protein